MTLLGDKLRSRQPPPALVPTRVRSALQSKLPASNARAQNNVASGAHSQAPAHLEPALVGWVTATETPTS
jgi:hypothetical protein